MFTEFFTLKLGDVTVKGRRLTLKEIREKRADLLGSRLDVDKCVELISSHVTLDDGDKFDPYELTPGQMRTILDGYRVVYHYGKKTGKMEEAKGKIDHYYIYGRRIEFYPEKIVVFDGYQTRCGAKTPDYRVSGDLIEIYPNHEILIYQAKIWIYRPS